MSSHIAWIDAFDADAAPWAGPKMARLGDLRRLGVPVPDGFVLPVAAFDRFLDQAGLRADIDHETAGLCDDDLESIERAAARIAARVRATPVTPSDLDAVEEAYARLAGRTGRPAPRVAVRSSATREDGADASFAGQYTTVLGVTGADALHAAVRECWASAFSAHALQYRLRHRMPMDACSMAVGVVELIEARAAGVAFSAHPSSGRRDRCVIEASFGWGEAVVQGLVTPDHAELDHSSGRLLDYRVGDKRVLSDWSQDAGRVVEGPMPEDLRKARVLDEVALSRLHEALRRIETHAGAPVDVEWVLGPRGNGTVDALTIVQTRPITTLPDAPPPPPRWDPGRYAVKYGLSGVR